MHEVYIITGLTGEEGFLRDAQRRLRDEGERTMMHYHKHRPEVTVMIPPGTPVACNDRCYIYPTVKQMEPDA